MHWRLALAGVILGFGAPLGWWGLRMLSAPTTSWREEWVHHAPLYLYLLLGTTLAFGLFGTGVGVLLERLRSANQRLTELSLTDALTELWNTRYFRERLAEECARAEREGLPLALIVGDLDHFKRVNDLWGHAFGDLALQHAARLVLAGARSTDIACRTGGEELALILPDATLEQAKGIAERIRASFEHSPLFQGGTPVALTISLGVASHQPGRGADSLFAEADRALYRAKAAGRNRVA